MICVVVVVVDNVLILILIFILIIIICWQASWLAVVGEVVGSEIDFKRMPLKSKKKLLDS